jgi:hypothetical protein
MVLGVFQTLRDQVKFVLRRLAPSFGFLLERMQGIDHSTEFHGIHRTERILPL